MEIVVQIEKEQRNKYLRNEDEEDVYRKRKAKH